MSFHIGEFKAGLRRHGNPLRSNKFEVRILRPPVLPRNNLLYEDLQFFAEQATLPGVNLSTHDVRRFGYGPIEKRPIGHTFTDLSVTFIADADGDMHRLFYNWISAISPYDYELSSQNLYLIRYKDEYATNIRIRAYKDNNIPSTTIYVREAFPISLSDIQVNWSEMSNHARFTVQFAYVDWSS